MIELVETNRPMLRVLKLAAKLHKAGLTADETVRFIINCRNALDAARGNGYTPEQLRGLFPSAAQDPTTILPLSFIWHGTVEGYAYWARIAERFA